MAKKVRIDFDAGAYSRINRLSNDDRQTYLFTAPVLASPNRTAIWAITFLSYVVLRRVGASCFVLNAGVYSTPATQLQLPNEALTPPGSLTSISGGVTGGLVIQFGPSGNPMPMNILLSPGVSYGFTMNCMYQPVAGDFTTLNCFMEWQTV